MSLAGEPSNNQLPSHGYVTVGQAAKYLGVSIDTLRRWERAGKLQAHRLDGKNRYFSVEDLEAFHSLKPLTTSQVAAALAISESTVRRLEREGQLPANRDANGKRLYDPLAVSQYIAAKQQKVNVAQLASVTETGVAQPVTSLSEAPESASMHQVSEQSVDLTRTYAEPITNRVEKEGFFGQRVFSATALAAI